MPCEERQFYQDTILKKSLTTSTMSSSPSNQSGCMMAGGDHSTSKHTITLSDENISQAGARGAKSNGTREGHHVTFAESPTEHTVSDHTDSSVIGTTEMSHNGHCDGSYLQYTDSSPTLDNNNKPLTSTSPTPQMAPLTPIIKLQRSASTESHENPFTADGELHKKADYIISHSTISRTELKITDPDTSKTQAPVVEEAVSPQEVSKVQSRPSDIAVPEQNGKVEEAITPSSVQVVEASQPQPQQAEQVKLKNTKKCACCVVQ